ncbi:MAG: helix-turn-helix domain-containing protein [Actinomycetota bacterium]|nr:helix-turn-helix domain-containing protein [Actinomycetota bacterium]
MTVRNEATTQSSGGVARTNGGVVSQNSSLGAYLSAARRHRGVSIASAADQTKIRADYLVRMEADDFAFLAPTYVRGFLKSYASFLAVSPGPLLAELDRRVGSTTVGAEQILAATRSSGKSSRPSGSSRRRAPLSGSAYRERRTGNWTLAAVLAAASLAALSLLGLLTDKAPRDRTQARSGGRAAASTVEAEREPSGASRPKPKKNPKEVGGRLALADGISLTIVASRDRCWVDVTSDGVNVLTEELALGEKRTVSARENMDIVLGNAQGVELIVNGRNIGSPGGTVVPLTLPDDIKSLL